MKRKDHGSRIVKYALGLVEVLFESIDIVDHDAAIPQLGLQLWDNIHAVMRHIL